jgi:hypothetical protein
MTELPPHSEETSLIFHMIQEMDEKLNRKLVYGRVYSRCGIVLRGLFFAQQAGS